jgi:hypothetical protein
MGSAPLTFNFTNAVAFFVWGATGSGRNNLQVTVTPPSSEGPPRTRILSDHIDGFDLDSLHYMETGLNRNSTYQVEWTNPVLTNVNENALDIRYVLLVDAVPA